MEQEHRGAPRFPFIAAAEVLAENNGSRMTARISDLSVSGCYVDTINPLADGTLVQVKIITESQVGVQKRGRWDVPGLSPPVKFVENPQRFRAAAGARIGPHEHTQHSRAAMRNGSGSLQYLDRFIKVFGADERKAEKPQSHR